MITWNERGYKGIYNAGLNWRYQKTDYIIQQSSNGDLYYIYDGAIQKILPTSTQIKQSDIIRNLDEIQYLSWEGVLLNNNKIGKWSAFWKYENLNIGGQYDEKGIKQGLWKELFKNYWDQSSITLKGEYRDEKERKMDGGGNYDENGLMQGLWVEIDDLFFNKCRVYYVGNYKQGKKSGLWDTKYQEKIIGGGIYNENGQKNGFWIELHENYFNQCYVHYSGKYLKGRKHGQWQIKYKKNTTTFEQLIGGGIFDFDGKKQGQWVELDENFSQQFEITHSGNYFNGKKKGTWRCMMRIDAEITQIGVGVYNKNGLKNGKWMELHENSIFRDPITCIGEYRNGVRIGKWRTFFCNQLMYQMIDQQVGQEFMILMEEKLVNGGFQGKILINIINLLNQVVLRMTKNLDFGKLYLTQGQLLCKLLKQTIFQGKRIYNSNGLKEGHWIDLDENNYIDQFVAYEGDYINGRKFGRWDTIFRQKCDDSFAIIGGGNYDEKGIKYGKWIDLIESFSQNRYVKFSGEYKCGKKQGRWDTLFKEFDEKQQNLLKNVGGGNYDMNGKKEGQWIDLHKEFWIARRTIYQGEYFKGRKKGSFVQKKI